MSTLKTDGIAQGREYSNALQAAPYRGDDKVVRIFFKFQRCNKIKEHAM